MRRFFELLTRIKYYVFGKHYVHSLYDKKYIGGLYFTSKYSKCLASGWKWVYYSGKMCKKTGVNLDVPWPVTHTSRVICPENIEFDLDDLNNFQSNGCYFQAIGAKIVIGKGTYIGPNVGIITANHDIHQINTHAEGKDVIIGKKCWIGMNSTILPGVKLGDGTIVGAGSVVTKSFIEGSCVIAGNPACIIKRIQD